jgi:hypothetical protein
VRLPLWAGAPEGLPAGGLPGWRSVCRKYNSHAKTQRAQRKSRKKEWIKSLKLLEFFYCIYLTFAPWCERIKISEPRMEDDKLGQKWCVKSSGDKDLTDLKSYKTIRIMKASEFLRLFK